MSASQERPRRTPGHRPSAAHDAGTVAPSPSAPITDAYVPPSLAGSKLPTQLPAPFGRYQLQKVLGQGGMGAVYLAHDTQLDRPVALKIPLFGAAVGSRVPARFYREARAAATILHANVCPVYDVGEVDGVPYLTMAYIEGKSLAEWIRAKPLTPRQSVALVRKLALALQEAHKKGVIHRDLKPANIMIDKRGEPIIMDFGLARRSRPGDARLTQLGDVIGTPAYMPPEQVSGKVDAMGPSCDIYSLGVILYELVAGRLPFCGDPMAMLSQVLLEEPPPPSKFRPNLDPALQSICLKAMAKKIENRYASMTEFAAALQDNLRLGNTTLASAPVQPAKKPEASRETERIPPRRRPRKSRRLLWSWIAGAALVGLLLLSGGAFLLLGQKTSSDHERGIVSAVPSTEAPAAEEMVSGLIAEIYQGREFEHPMEVRIDKQVDAVWKSSPDKDVVPAGPFSIRWTGWLEAATAGPYKFSMVIDDGARLWLDKRLLIDAWQPGQLRRVEAEMELTQGRHSLRIDYFEFGVNPSTMKLQWRQPGAPGEQVVPAEALLHGQRVYEKIAARLPEAEKHFFDRVPEDALGYLLRAAANYHKRNYDSALADFKEWLRLVPPKTDESRECWDYYRNLAWQLATSPAAPERFSTVAVALAQRAYDMRAQWKDWRFLDTLAAAYADAGQFEQAVRCQTEALGMARDEQTKNDLDARLALYQARKAFRR